MNRDIFDPDGIFIGLLEGRIPSGISRMDPGMYAEMLIEAIRFHEDQMKEASEEADFSAEIQEMIYELIRDDPDQLAGFWPDYQMDMERLPEDIAFSTEKMLVAKTMKEQCESELLRLLESHPELKDKL